MNLVIKCGTGDKIRLKRIPFLLFFLLVDYYYTVY